MNRILCLTGCLLLESVVISELSGQIEFNTDSISSSSSFHEAHPVQDRTVLFNVSDSGAYKPINWGLDLAWLSRDNIIRGMAFMGKERVDIIRSSFTPTAPIDSGELRTNEMEILNSRLEIIDLVGPTMNIVLNSDHPSVDPYFKGNAEHWAELIDVTARHHQDRGHNVITVSPFNEPDYSATGQGTIQDFYNIAGELRLNPRFDSIRISGGNTLNTDQALPWYNTLKDRLDEGNTHQLAGNFDNYAAFFETVRANGHHATNDELHNVMEAMVGVEYGLQTGIWWGTAEYARGEFVKASDGRRIAYSEHRPNWTSASVYRNTENKLQAFVGSSERQAVTTTYRFLSLEREVFYNGHGPQREFTVVMPGGTGYQQGQTNAECVVNISWGEDVQPVVNGKYKLVNRNSGKVLEVQDGASFAGANLQQGTDAGATYQQFNVIPVDSRVGGDFSYFTLTSVNSSRAIDVFNWSLNDGGNLVIWDKTNGTNQQWYIQYADSGWFYIRSRHSAKCLEVAASATTNGANVQQGEYDEETNQQWRFLPTDANVEFDPPAEPSNLKAFSNPTSVMLQWTKNSETDLAGYVILRADSIGGPYNVIARNIQTTSFVDNTILQGDSNYYVIKSVDKSLNQSGYSNEVVVAYLDTADHIAHFAFENNAIDSTINLHHASTYGSSSYTNGKNGSQAIALNGSNAFIQLPSYIANHREITIATWIYWKGGGNWQRIFDFGNGQDQYMFLTPKSGSGGLGFAIKNKDEEQQLNAGVLPMNQWVHIAISLGETGAALYVNGELADESDAITISPMDFKPLMNYIGRSQYSDPLLRANIEDFNIFNYVLTPDDIKKMATADFTAMDEIKVNLANQLKIWPIPADQLIHVQYNATNIVGQIKLELCNMNGRVILQKEFSHNTNMEMDVSQLPSGIYFLKCSVNGETEMKKIIIHHP